MTTLSWTHLYGRHLVLEWAEAADEDENGKVDVDAVKEKAKRDVMQAGLGGTGKRENILSSRLRSHVTMGTIHTRHCGLAGHYHLFAHLHQWTIACKCQMNKL